MNKSYLYLNEIPLSELPVGITVQISDLRNTGLSRRRMMDLGFIPGTSIEILRKSPLGDPTAYRIRGAAIALRKEEAANIFVKPIISC